MHLKPPIIDVLNDVIPFVICTLVLRKVMNRIKSPFKHQLKIHSLIKHIHKIQLKFSPQPNIKFMPNNVCKIHFLIELTFPRHQSLLCVFYCAWHQSQYFRYYCYYYTGLVDLFEIQMSDLQIHTDLLDFLMLLAAHLQLEKQILRSKKPYSQPWPSSSIVERLACVHKVDDKITLNKQEILSRQLSNTMKCNF